MMPNHCKEIGVRKVEYRLTTREIISNLIGTPIYRKTKYLLLNRKRKWAIAAIEKKSFRKGLFRTIASIRILSLPDNTQYLQASDVDVMNHSHMARAYSRAHGKYLIVRGRYEHMSFVTDEYAIMIKVIDIVPPSPPHLLDLAQRAIECGLVNASVIITERLVDLTRLAGKAKTRLKMLPCSCSDIKTKTVLFLDRCPEIPRKNLKDITLVGCNRSAKIFNSVYGLMPHRISMCPIEIIRGKRIDNPTLVRCCELKQKLRIVGNLAMVPWDASLEQVARAINILTRISVAVK